MSMKAPGSLGSVGSPGFGSSATRTAPSVGSWWLAAFAAVGIAWSLMPGMIAVKTFGATVDPSSR